MLMPSLQSTVAAQLEVLEITAREAAGAKLAQFPVVQQVTDLQALFAITGLLWRPKPDKLAAFISTFSFKCKPGSAIPLVLQAIPQADVQALCLRQHKKALNHILASINPFHSL